MLCKIFALYLYRKPKTIADMKTIKDLKQRDAVYVLRNDGTTFQTTAELVGATNDVSRRVFLRSGGAFSLYLFDEWWCDGVGNMYFCDADRLRMEVKRQIKEREMILTNLKALDAEE